MDESRELREGRIAANGLDFAVLEAGPADGPLALCLHGFPDSARTWVHLLPELAAEGFHAVAPWLRGYAPTEVPPDGRYQTGALVADAVALHEVLGGDERAVLVGHDWGAAVAYGAAAFAPERWRRVVTMALPPPAVFMGALLDYAQLRRSWYMFFFQHPLAESAVAEGDLSFIAKLWADWSPGHDHPEELEHAKAALRPPGHLAAALGYYRASIGGTPPPDPALAAEQQAVIQLPPQPLLYLHGADDGCAGVDMGRAAEAVLTSEGSKVAIVDDAGHFLHLDRTAEVNRLVIEFLSRS